MKRASSSLFTGTSGPYTPQEPIWGHNTEQEAFHKPHHNSTRYYNILEIKDMSVIRCDIKYFVGFFCSFWSTHLNILTFWRCLQWKCRLWRSGTFQLHPGGAVAKDVVVARRKLRVSWLTCIRVCDTSEAGVHEEGYKSVTWPYISIVFKL